MKIIVCMKQVPDPEGPQSSFVIQPEPLRVEPRGLTPLISVYDENALEVALQLKEATVGPVKITILSLGHRISNNIMAKAVACGADELVKVEDEAFAAGRLGGEDIARALALAIEKLGEYDLILTGREAADSNAAQVGIGIAHFLGIPAVTLGRRIAATKTHLIVERVLANTVQKVKTPMPALVTVTNDAGFLRYPALPKLMEARKRPAIVWKADDIGFDPTTARNPLVLKELHTPALRTRHCMFIDGDSARDAGRELARRLQQDGVL